MAFDPQTLINSETGEFDWTVIKRQAVIRAQREYGDCAPPNSYVRSELRTLQDQADALRRSWRAERGIADEAALVPGFQVVEPWYKRRMWDPRAGQWVTL